MRLSIAILPLLCCSCVGMFRAGTLDIPDWPLTPESQTRPTVRMCVRGELRTNRLLSNDLSPGGVSTVGELGVKAYEGSGLFHWAKGSVTRDADLYAYVEYGDVRRPPPSLELTLCTLFVYPSVVRDEMTLKTTFKNRSGATLGQVEVSESLVRILSLFMLPLAPFTMSWTPEQDVIYDLHRATIVEAQRRGYFRR